MSRPSPSGDFVATAPTLRVSVVDGLPDAIDVVAQAAAPPYRFLRAQWFAAACQVYGGHARTVMVEEDGVPSAVLPFVRQAPRALGLAAVPGCYWPFRSVPLSLGASEKAPGALLREVGRVARGLRIGPVYDGDPGTGALVAAARAAGWAVLDRFVAESWLLDMAAQRGEGGWPRSSTLRKNRFHEKHLAAHGTLDWSFIDAADWPGAFDLLAQVEERSWVATHTDGGDAKFTASGHGAFWRAAARDPMLAGMFRAALLRVEGVPAAFSFDMDVGETKYAVANSYVPDYAKHSPGKLLYWRNLSDAIGRGITLVDWGAGDSGYKKVIGAEPGPGIRDWLLLRPGLPAAVGRALAFAWRASGHREG